MIGQEQMQIGLNAQALASYRAARALNGGSTSYGEEIARLLAVTGDVTGAARETVAMFTADGDLVQVQRRLSVLLATDAGASAIATQLNELPDTYLDVLRLKQWFYRQTKAWRKALDVTEKLDAQGRVRGQELLLFADGARNDEQYDVAVDAYGIVLREVTDERYRMSAAYGAARALDQKLRTARSIGPDEARILVARYDDIITRYGQHPIAAEALYHAAVLEDDVLGERDAARDRLLRVMNAWRGTTTWTDAALRLADMHLAAGRDPDAVSILRSVMVGPQSIVGDRRDLAALRLGDLHLWAGNIDSARSYYAPLASTPSSMAANDAIDRLLLIDLAQDDSATVIAIASAEGLFARRSYGAAGRAFAAAAAAARDNELRDRALFRGATAFVRAADDSSAGPLLQSLVSSVPESIYGDRALFLVAEILQRRGDRKGALQALDAILVNYPRSILVPVARDRIRVLRGDA
jgi:tetratricopeptide (TPR) repeat protein